MANEWNSRLQYHYLNLTRIPEGNKVNSIRITIRILQSPPDREKSVKSDHKKYMYSAKVLSKWHSSIIV